MNDTSGILRRTTGIYATDSGAVTALISDYGMTAGWTGLRHLEYGFAAVTLALNALEYLGDYLSSLAHDNGITYSDIPLGNEVDVMKSCS